MRRKKTGRQDGGWIEGEKEREKKMLKTEREKDKDMKNGRR